MAEDLKDLLAQATQELGVNVPVCAYEREGTGLKLWLYGQGDKPITWKPKAKRTTRKKKVTDE